MAGRGRERRAGTEPPRQAWVALVAWYEREGRRLAIREAATPWAVLVAEVMSQQTQG